jgi:hypothetical protein
LNAAVKFRAVIFDLDDTLVWDERLSRQALMETAARGAAVHQLDAGRLATAAKQAGDELWRDHAPVDRCDQLGIVAFEGMWGHFHGEEDYLRHLREWTPRFRREIWERALHDQGIGDAHLAAELGDFFALRRRELQEICTGLVSRGIELPDTFVKAAGEMHDPAMLGDLFAQHLVRDPLAAQQILSEPKLSLRLGQLVDILRREWQQFPS